jgi:AcrR family transcriptional regulator
LLHRFSPGSVEGWRSDLTSDKINLGDELINVKILISEKIGRQDAVARLIKRPHDRYHHGALREALMIASERLLAEQGLEGFSLREVARRANVSSAAPTHHFGDIEGLFTALAVNGFNELTERVARAKAEAGGDAERFLENVCRSYVDFAFERPAVFELMFRCRRLNTNDPKFLEASSRAFFAMATSVVGRTSIEDVGGDSQGPLDVVTVWAMIHGFAHLAIEQMLDPFKGEGSVRDFVATALAAALRALRKRPR